MNLHVLGLFRWNHNSLRCTLSWFSDLEKEEDQKGLPKGNKKMFFKTIDTSSTATEEKGLCCSKYETVFLLVFLLVLMEKQRIWLAVLNKTVIF